MLEKIYDRLEVYSQYVDKLPETDREFYYYAVRKRFKQKAIAKIMGVTQGAVSSRLSKIMKRVKFLEVMSSFDLEKIDEDLGDILDPFEREILKQLAETTCQEDTARRVNVMFNTSGKKVMNQVKIRHRFQKAWAKLVEAKNENIKKYVTLFGFIQENLYMMHEVKLPQFERQIVHGHEDT